MAKNLLGLMKRLLLLSFSIFVIACQNDGEGLLSIREKDRIVFVGNNLCSRMFEYGHFETALHQRYPDSLLFVRNICDGGNTPGFRPHSARMHPFAFQGAEKFHQDYTIDTRSEGHFPSDDEWLEMLKANVMIAMFGFVESFEGEQGLDNFILELEAFCKHVRNQDYNDGNELRLVLCSPIAFESIDYAYELPDIESKNNNLLLYSMAMEEFAQKNGIPFVDLYHASLKWFESSENLTIDGFQLNEKGNYKLSLYLLEKIYGSERVQGKINQSLLDAVRDKNWFWHNDYKSPNGVHVYGRRYDPFGPDNYPFEIKKNREMTLNRDSMIWSIARGLNYDLSIADAATTSLPAVETNYKLEGYGFGKESYLYGEDALESIKVAEGFKLELFASEEEFEELANPVQMSFDNKGRLWVAVMPTYPHYRPGDEMPNDKLIILEDINKDGKADKLTVWADSLHIPVGFEFAPEGVYVSQGTHLKLLTDTDGDDKADKEEIILSGFDDHDTHHVISAFCADPSGAIVMGEGVFLHSNIETLYGTVRATNGGFFRYSPQRKYLERTAQISIPNPWGIAFDDWGQDFFAETSGPNVRWMSPSNIEPRYGVANPMTKNLIEPDHMVRPTSGLEFVSSRHFPEEMQGDLLINNTIGFLGMKQHEVLEDGTGFSTKHRQDLVSSTDKNFRPVDMEFAPDGSLYFLDWHNVLIGHMQHNARDPLRDHVHGRVYRVSYPSRPLVDEAEVHGASIENLFENLKLPEYRSRYRTRRELRARKKSEVLEKLEQWMNQQEENDKAYEHHMLEAIWVYWGFDAIESEHIKKLLGFKDHRARAAAIRVLRYSHHRIPNYQEIMEQAAKDEHGRVRLEAITAASWFPKKVGLSILETAGEYPMDEWMEASYETSRAHLNGTSVELIKNDEAKSNLIGEELELYKLGEEIYHKEAYCGTCHQPNGQGLIASEYPSLSKTDWVNGSKERLIKLTLKGLYGPIDVNGKSYKGAVPMTAFEKLLNDEEVAAVLTFIKNSFGNDSGIIEASLVSKVREEIKDKEGFYEVEELE